MGLSKPRGWAGNGPRQVGARRKKEKGTGALHSRQRPLKRNKKKDEIRKIGLSTLGREKIVRGAFLPKT